MYTNIPITKKVVALIFLFSAIFTAVITYLNLDKGFIFNDEAYYLFHYKNDGQMLNFDRTNFFRIFRFLYTPNIYHFRIISITTLVISNYLLCFAVLKYFKIVGNLFLFSFLGIALGFLGWNATNLIIQQYIGNTILVNLGIAALLFAQLYNANSLKIISGFIISFILFNGNSHATVLAPIILFAFFSEKENWKKKFPLFLLGFALGILVYFTFLDSISNFKYQLTFLKEYMGFHRKQHSIKFMIYWVVYLLANGMLPILIALAILWKSKFSANSIHYLSKIIDIVGAITIFTFVVFPAYYTIFLILLVHFMVLRFCLQKDIAKNEKYLAILLLLVPYGLAFGSQIWFTIRVHVYLIYYVLLIFLIILKNKKLNINWILGFTFLFVIYSFSFPNILHEKGWKDFVFTQQTEPVKINGYALLLDKGRKKDIEDLRPYLQNQPKVIYSSNHLMGYLYILDAYPPIPYYFTLKNYIKFIIEKKGTTPDDYIYIESNDYPFSPKEFLPLQFVKHPEKYRTVKAGRFTLYLPENWKRK